MIEPEEARPAAGDAVPVPSPCVGHCRPDDAEVCLGCGRTIDEVAAWPKADAAERRAIRARAASRRAIRRDATRYEG
ncbi:DUF1289 domain-containing protein [Roseomonas sp. NAR14]|uniref:DUF1289 domain-containing protein n=1 Tax=Roseomonas acroporae TaxID=2937791 RepID=A0A9X1YCR6_9PROT|nr:DUF1289 domain-containing protein [Roseomonas acroporae]MCK8787761.1 DUF1289 domain-containing protein [Roseomonas acroporae]